MNTGTDEKNNTSSSKNTSNVEYSSKAKPGSIAAKANMVKEYNEKNNK